MRIKDLATRATKLLTGNAYMVFDNGTKVEKVDYAEFAKQIITEYNTQTLAGSAQSVKSALDALNSKLGPIKQVNETVVTANATITLTVENQSKACVYIIGADSNTICILIISANAQGTVACKKLGEAPSIQTSSPNANRLDITSSSSTNPNAYIMCFYGSVTKA